MPPGTTECNHSYFSGNSFSAPHFAQQLQNGTLATPAQPPASIQEVNGPASSGFVSSSQLSRSAISSQVTAGPTRNGTGDVMPLAEAITQLSFLEFLQHCGVSIAPPQPSQPPVPISLHSWTLLCRRLHLVTSLRRCPRRRLINRTRFRVIWQCRRLPTVPISYPWMLPRRRPHPVPLSQHVSTQMGSRSASSFSVDTSVQTPVRSAVLHDVATQLPVTEFFVGCIYSNNPLGPPKRCSSVPAINARFTCLAAATARTRTASPRLLSLPLTLTC